SRFLGTSCVMVKVALLVIVMCLAIFGSTLAKPAHIIERMHANEPRMRAEPVRTKRLAIQVPSITFRVK
uniref:Transmembrane protein n=1 Tax=Haemonchus contortus TaxID=6289 RepID=A0A7I5EBB5_HAECO